VLLKFQFMTELEVWTQLGFKPISNGKYDKTLNTEYIEDFRTFLTRVELRVSISDKKVMID
jgi:hypothetical protein